MSQRYSADDKLTRVFWLQVDGSENIKHWGEGWRREEEEKKGGGRGRRGRKRQRERSEEVETERKKCCPGYKQLSNRTELNTVRVFTLCVCVMESMHGWIELFVPLSVCECISSPTTETEGRGRVNRHLPSQLSCSKRDFHFCSHYPIKCTMLLELTWGRQHIKRKG